jgi:hypothetical protein
MRARSTLAVLRLGLIAVSMAACGTLGSRLTPSESTTTLTAGWDHWFKLDWSVEQERGGANRIRGYIGNQYGGPAGAVRLLAQALDASGAVVGEQIAFVPGGVGGFGRAYFEIDHLPVADHYRVSVWDYSFREADRQG